MRPSTTRVTIPTYSTINLLSRQSTIFGWA